MRLLLNVMNAILLLGLLVNCSAQSQAPLLFSLNSQYSQNNEAIYYVPLCDVYPWYEEEDSFRIAEEYLDADSVVNNNYHLLTEKQRSDFLEKTVIDETDSLYIYNFLKDTSVVYSIKKVQLVAFINIYGFQGQLRKEEYVVGLELKTHPFPDSNYYNNLVYIGKENPFSIGQIQSMVWDSIPKEKVPNQSLSQQDSLILGEDATRHNAFHYQDSIYNYYLQDIGYHGRRLLVTESKNEKVVFNKIYYNSEGASLLPLNGTKANYDWPNLQWTGKLFKNQPPLIFGFIAYSFGCLHIDFLEKADYAVRVNCDNRH